MDDPESPVDTLTEPLLFFVLEPLDNDTEPLASAPLALAMATLPLHHEHWGGPKDHKVPCVSGKRHRS